ncbi:TadE/TadG family type IV pilus assembly protein [Streptomyces sp. B6B3]|uniref:TadE/TadG family type IV pilus assembly protein n=1 Tax=Streptomyces sp. B6B3 TaxID=3153570 RepID=UPI00325D5AA9
MNARRARTRPAAVRRIGRRLTARLTGRARGGDRGVTAVEFAGWLPILALVALAGVQLGIVGYGALQAGSAARAAARAAAQEELEEQAQQIGQRAVSDWLDVEITIDPCGEETTATAVVDIPSVLPLLNDLEATRTVTMPCDGTPPESP